MNVLLISANTETMNMVPLPLGLNCIAVAARDAGHAVRLVDLMGSGDNRSAIRDAVAELRPGVIGISIRNVDNQQMAEPRFLLEGAREAVSACRGCSDAMIVLGGAGFSIFPGPVLEYLHADAGICGEGEGAFLRLLDALERGDDLSSIEGVCLPGSSVKQRTGRLPLEELPLPDPALWSAAASSPDIWIPFQSRRGCPMRCSYCSTPLLEGTAIRCRPVEKVVEGIRRHVQVGFRSFYFVDNTFNFPVDYARELCSALASAALPIRWRAILYPGRIDRELVARMAEAGCVEVSLGFESGSRGILRSLNKKYDPEEVREGARLLKEYGIRRMGFLLFGAPGETEETVRESLDFADSLELEMLKVTAGIRIYPGTPLAATARTERVIDEDDALLYPRFYLAKGMEEWISPLLSEWMATRPWCAS